MIHFVGAGSGAADLITIRGARLLEAADVIVYAGSLVNPALLDYAKPGCEIHNSARMTLEEVMDVMLSAEQAGRQVVRLHTGDPCLYGAIREQMDLLDARGVAYDVAPGVSSFCGAAAALKAEYTRGVVPGTECVVLGRAAKQRAAGLVAVPRFCLAQRLDQDGEPDAGGGQFGGAAGDKIKRMIRADPFQAKNPVEAAAQLRQECQRPAQIDHTAGNFPALRQAGDGLVDHGCKNTGGDIFLFRALVQERLDI